MSAYRDAFHISSAEQGARLRLAAQILAEGAVVVVLDHALALRPVSEQTILCEVISAGSTAPQNQVEKAKHLLEVSTLSGFVDTGRCKWLVVKDYGEGTLELWRES
jgi:hypothetical protein